METLLIYLFCTQFFRWNQNRIKGSITPNQIQQISLIYNQYLATIFIWTEFIPASLIVNFSINQIKLAALIRWLSDSLPSRWFSSLNSCYINIKRNQIHTFKMQKPTLLSHEIWSGSSSFIRNGYFSWNWPTNCMLSLKWYRKKDELTFME